MALCGQRHYRSSRIPLRHLGIKETRCSWGWRGRHSFRLSLCQQCIYQSAYRCDRPESLLVEALAPLLLAESSKLNDLWKQDKRKKEFAMSSFGKRARNGPAYGASTEIYS